MHMNIQCECQPGTCVQCILVISLIVSQECMFSGRVLFFMSVWGQTGGVLTLLFLCMWRWMGRMLVVYVLELTLIQNFLFLFPGNAGGCSRSGLTGPHIFQLLCVHCSEPRRARCLLWSGWRDHLPG